MTAELTTGWWHRQPVKWKPESIISQCMQDYRHLSVQIIGDMTCAGGQLTCQVYGVSLRCHSSVTRNDNAADESNACNRQGSARRLTVSWQAASNRACFRMGRLSHWMTMLTLQPMGYCGSVDIRHKGSRHTSWQDNCLSGRSPCNYYSEIALKFCINLYYTIM